ncbi:MAG: PTS-dependent dihydroxyacetone kinase phosphotransferase subunit DhaM [Caldilineaceae bacterium]|nr:PTS-dependent dihydroxyacetone kinase phosphotransferase subunit DhaM [Caldilineaceae bacterium]
MATVSLVLVSHSQTLARGVKELADQMADQQVQIEIAGGVVDPQSDVPLLGTDALQILAAIERCWSAAGVLLLVDLGSAVLNAELAIDLLPLPMQAGCLISNAPLVEGAVVAALEASLQQPLAVVNRAAEATGTLAKVTPRLES